MAESMIRVERSQGFTVLQNDMLRDPRLSLKTKGLMAVLLGLPEDWKYSVSGLAKICGTGKDAIRSSLGELEAAGYLNREQSHAKSGKFGGNAYVIYEVSRMPLSENPTTVEECGQPLSGKPSTAEPSTENPTQLNKQVLNKDLSNTPQSPPRGDKPSRRRRAKAVPVWRAEKFEGFWKNYPRDEDRAKAVEEWDKLPLDRELMDRHGGSEDDLLTEIALGLKRHLECEDWREGRGIPYAFRWLRDRKWTEKRKQVQSSGRTRGAEPQEVRYGVR